MGEGIPASQDVVAQDQLPVCADHPAPCSRTSGRRARKRKAIEPLPALGEQVARTVGHFFPRFDSWLQAFPDPRCQGKVVYEKALCIWEAMNIFILGLGSRRQFDHEARKDAATTDQCLLQNFNRLAKTEALDIAHGDTVNDYLKELDPGHLRSASPQ